MASYWLRKQPVSKIYGGFMPIESPLLPRLSFSASDLFAMSCRSLKRRFRQSG
jgi:hypothetical protein